MRDVYKLTASLLAILEVLRISASLSGHKQLHVARAYLSLLDWRNRQVLYVLAPSPGYFSPFCSIIIEKKWPGDEAMYVLEYIDLQAVYFKIGGLRV